MSHCPDLDAGRRARELAGLAGGPPVDVLVAGGGVTGAGVALDAVTRGLSVALVERGDLATGTSRWSSKLAHGGLRYLTRGDVGVAWESARERAILAAHTAPHLVRALPFLIPVGPRLPRPHAAGVSAILRAGDLLRAAARTSSPDLARVRRVSADEARLWAPALRRQDLHGAIMHWDCQLEDDARLVLGLARTAAAHGARILTRVRAERLDGDGADVVDDLTGARLRVRARHVINAAGVWAGELQPSVVLRPSRGSHLLVRAAVLGEPRAAVSLPLPGSHTRWVFALPRPDGLALLGLTDEPHEAPPSDAPEVTPAEEAALLEHIGAPLGVGPSDVVGRYAGLRPLLAGAGERTADLSRRHALIEDDGVLAVVGGKLTTYRAMAQDAVDLVAARTGVRAGPCRTARLPLAGAGAGAAPAGLPERLVRRYGAEAERVAALAEGRPDLLAPIAPGVPVLGAEILFAVRAEGALTVADVVERRTRADAVPEWAAAVEAATLRLAPELGDTGPAAAAA